MTMTEVRCPVPKAALTTSAMAAMRTPSASARVTRNVEAAAAFAEPPGHPDQDLGSVLEDAYLANLAAAAAFGQRDAYRRLMHIQSDKDDIVHQARPLA